MKWLTVARCCRRVVDLLVMAQVPLPESFSANKMQDEIDASLRSLGEKHSMWIAAKPLARWLRSAPQINRWSYSEEFLMEATGRAVCASAG